MSALKAKLLGFLPFGLAAVLAVVSAFAWLQTDRLSSARAVIKAQLEAVGLLEDRIVNDAARIEERDKLIAKQNAAVLSIVEQQQADRQAYLDRMAQADRRAAGLQAQASDIMQRHVETTDELERAREALRLIHEVVGQES